MNVIEFLRSAVMEVLQWSPKALVVNTSLRVTAFECWNIDGESCCQPVF